MDDITYKLDQILARLGRIEDALALDDSDPFDNLDPGLPVLDAGVLFMHGDKAKLEPFTGTRLIQFDLDPDMTQVGFRYNASPMVAVMHLRDIRFDILDANLEPIGHKFTNTYAGVRNRNVGLATAPSFGGNWANRTVSHLPAVSPGTYYLEVTVKNDRPVALKLEAE
jgi:hypothetical protein